MACREMLRRLLWRLDLLELRTQGEELLITERKVTERKVGGGEVEHHSWIGRPHAYLGPPGDEVVRLIALPLEQLLKKAGEVRPQDTGMAMRSMNIL